MSDMGTLPDPGPPNTPYTPTPVVETWHCTNSSCSQLNVDKLAQFEYPEVICGECQTPLVKNP